MKTKIVYVVISGNNDFYFEQVWASAWSLKKYNPQAYVMVLTDKETKQTIYSDERKESLNSIDEIKVINLDDKYSNKEKSRWIKTNLRKLISGDFLFIDADTIITGSLDQVDSFKCSIGAVLDSHCHSCDINDTIVFKDMYIDHLKNIFNTEYQNEDVFNSGVLYVKDDKLAHHFFDIWHKNWQLCRSKGICLDQLSLLKTNIELGNLIFEIPGEYNCQIRFSVQYLTRAKIIHTFATQKKSNISILLGPSLYKEIKHEHHISNNVSETLLKCKETFSSPSYLVGKEWMKLWFMPAFSLIYSTYDSNRFLDKIAFSSINFIARGFSFLLRQFHKQQK